MKIKIIVCVIFLFSTIRALCDDIRISLFNNHQVGSIAVGALNGELVVSTDDSVKYFRYVIADGQEIHATLQDGEILLMDESYKIGSFERIIIKSADSSAVVRLKPVAPQLEARNYEDLIIMTAENNRIRIINHIDPVKYIAAVVEAETGTRQTAEFYKAKAIICRTYLFANLERHQHEGFHLCDEVHCQAHKGQSRNSEILSAVRSTDNIVIIDPQTSKPILAAYHSNCGGITELAQNVWQSSLPYFVPVVDPYCSNSPNARWQRRIPLDEWINYLIRKGYTPNPDVAVDFYFQQLTRTNDYKIGNISIPFRQLRTDWNLRSTFFSISIEDGAVMLNGRGFGHGVGLCQEGAMEMARRGFKYHEIINYYYKDVRLATFENEE